MLVILTLPWDPSWGAYERIAMLIPAKSRKGQGSLEYIMMLSAVGIVVVVALAMVIQLKGTALHAFTNNGTSISAQLSNELNNLTNSV